MRRREFLQSTAAAAVLGLAPAARLSAAVQPDWTSLKAKLGDRLIDIQSPLVECVSNGGAGADALFTALKNPYYLSDEPSLTQTLGWIDAWTSRPSVKGVAAESADDVAEAIRFARRSGIAPVVKGGGHSYFGNSNRAGSLLIWTHRLRDIALHDAFIPLGAPAGSTALAAVSVGAGCRWGEVYRKVAVENGRYVQGGGCLTVGVGGFVLGGGFGSFSKQFGTGAANLLEAEIVTADGQVRTVNRFRDPELFFALRGGGGGTFGVVTRFTLRTHPLPASAGLANFEVDAADGASWRQLVAKMIEFYADALFNPSWGEQIRFGGRRRLEVNMLSHGLSQDEVARTWAPFIDWVRSMPGLKLRAQDPLFLAIPGRSLWDPAFLKNVPGVVISDDRPGASADNVFWTGNLEEAAQVLDAYQSAWLPNSLLEPARQGELVDAIVRAAAHWTITLHVNKGLGGGNAEAIAATRETATNPKVCDSFALLICASQQQPAYPGIPGHEPNVVEGRRAAAAVTAAMGEIHRVAPDSGAYMSEADYFQKDWQRAFWGVNYRRLAAIKRRVDPHNLFRGHYCVEPT